MQRAGGPAQRFVRARLGTTTVGQASGEADAARTPRRRAWLRPPPRAGPTTGPRCRSGGGNGWPRYTPVGADPRPLSPVAGGVAAAGTAQEPEGRSARPRAQQRGNAGTRPRGGRAGPRQPRGPARGPGAPAAGKTAGLAGRPAAARRRQGGSAARPAAHAGASRRGVPDATCASNGPVSRRSGGRRGGPTRGPERHALRERRRRRGAERSRVAPLRRPPPGVPAACPGLSARRRGLAVLGRGLSRWPPPG